MTKDEMQRYLNQVAREGKEELTAYRMLMEVLGLNYPSGMKAEKEEEVK